jgi:tRNA threonylcarbamoyladenosine biosynthesis protein TsaE
MRTSRETHSETETMHLAANLARGLVAGDVVSLNGPLGAGKTCFVRGLAAGLGIDAPEVSSPTYVLAHEYIGPSLTLVHVDAYRLSGPEELESIGWDELVAARDAVIAIEWPGRVSAALPQPVVAVDLAPLGATTRRVVIDIPDALADRFEQLRPASPCRCPTCGRDVPAAAADFPFCSERCRRADLGRWFAGKYRLTRHAGDDEAGT